MPRFTTKENLRSVVTALRDEIPTVDNDTIKVNQDGQLYVAASDGGEYPDVDVVSFPIFDNQSW